jgi:hypothetical protein
LQNHTLLGCRDPEKLTPMSHFIRPDFTVIGKLNPIPNDGADFAI